MYRRDVRTSMKMQCEVRSYTPSVYALGLVTGLVNTIVVVGASVSGAHFALMLFGSPEQFGNLA